MLRKRLREISEALPKPHADTDLDYSDRCGGGLWGLTCPAYRILQNGKIEWKLFICIPTIFEDPEDHTEKRTTSCRALGILEHEFVHVRQFGEYWGVNPRANPVIDRDKAEEEAYTRMCVEYANQKCLKGTEWSEDVTKCIKLYKGNSTGGNVTPINSACQKVVRRQGKGKWKAY